jgi:hypothetical protein
LPVSTSSPTNPNGIEPPRRRSRHVVATVRPSALIEYVASVRAKPASEARSRSSALRAEPADGAEAAEAEAEAPAAEAVEAVEAVAATRRPRKA